MSRDAHLSPDAKRTPVATASAQISPNDEGSIAANGNTGLSLPPALEARLARLEQHIDIICPMACHGSRCAFACPISLPDAVAEVLRNVGGAA